MDEKNKEWQSRVVRSTVRFVLWLVFKVKQKLIYVTSMKQSTQPMYIHIPGGIFMGKHFFLNFVPNTLQLIKKLHFVQLYMMCVIFEFIFFFFLSTQPILTFNSGTVKSSERLCIYISLIKI